MCRLERGFNVFMEAFSQFVGHVDSMIWSMVLVLLCLGVGLYLSIRMKFPQIRFLKEMVHLLGAKEESENGITPFQAFATTVGARVGMGNIAGVASAIYFGGPGSVFWMWIITLIGAASAYTESALGQAYKVKNPDGEYMGGPAYYIEKGLKCKPYAILFAMVAFLGPGFLMPGVQINSLVTVFEEAFSVNKILVGAICCVILGIVVYGSIKRIAKIAEMLAPVMCGIYIVAAVVILGLNITKLPGILGMVVSSAFGKHAVFGGILGSAVSWGVKRGIYSNEAGMGCGAIVSAAAECSHPAKQGLIQSFSIYVDTLFIGTATALIILLTGTFDVCDGAGNLLLDQTGGIEAGIKWTQYALMNSIRYMERQGAGDHHCAVCLYIYDGILLSGRSEYPLSYPQQQIGCQYLSCRFPCSLIFRSHCECRCYLVHGRYRLWTYGLGQYHCHCSVGAEGIGHAGGLRTAEEGRQESGL